MLGEDSNQTSDEIVTSIPTLMEPVLLESEDPIGVVIHIDDCLCTFCEDSRGILKIGSTVLLEVTDSDDTMILRLLPEEALLVAKALIKHTGELEDMSDQGAWDYI